MNEKLTTAEEVDLLKLKKIVANAEVAFVEAGKALTAIRDRKLYRFECKTFEEFCQKHWGFKRAHAYRLIESSKVVLSPTGRQISNERQARALAVVPMAQRDRVMDAASKSGEVTAKAITKAAAEVDKPRVTAGPEPVYDMVGIKVTAKAMPYWERSIEVKEMMAQISAIKCTIEKAQSAGDKMFIEVGNSTIADLKLCREGISYALPFTVCPTCNGQLVDKCSLCRGRGVVSKRLYETVDSKTREIREKMAKKGGAK